MMKRVMLRMLLLLLCVLPLQGFMYARVDAFYDTRTAETPLEKGTYLMLVPDEDGTEDDTKAIRLVLGEPQGGYYSEVAFTNMVDGTESTISVIIRRMPRDVFVMTFHHYDPKTFQPKGNTVPTYLMAHSGQEGRWVIYDEHHAYWRMLKDMVPDMPERIAARDDPLPHLRWVPFTVTELNDQFFAGMARTYREYLVPHAVLKRIGD